ncbi:hypothetical protein C8Q80DRAFT_757382 [Daedaleopsis nitida]|nr:hypothetical protein C8Q80DRAFT_757382 [Daedaleopsis nitida]
MCMAGAPWTSIDVCSSIALVALSIATKTQTCFVSQALTTVSHSPTLPYRRPHLEPAVSGAQRFGTAGWLRQEATTRFTLPTHPHRTIRATWVYQGENYAVFLQCFVLRRGIAILPSSCCATNQLASMVTCTSSQSQSPDINE